MDVVEGEPVARWANHNREWTQIYANFGERDGPGRCGVRLASHSGREKIKRNVAGEKPTTAVETSAFRLNRISKDSRSLAFIRGCLRNSLICRKAHLQVVDFQDSFTYGDYAVTASNQGMLMIVISISIFAMFEVRRRFPARAVREDAYVLDESFTRGFVNKLFCFQCRALHKSANLCKICGFPKLCEAMDKFSFRTTIFWLSHVHGMKFIPDPKPASSAITCCDGIIPTYSQKVCCANRAKTPPPRAMFVQKDGMRPGITPEVRPGEGPPKNGCLGRVRIPRPPSHPCAPRFSAQWPNQFQCLRTRWSIVETF